MLNLKQNGIFFAQKSHQRFFGPAIDPEMRLFLVNLFWSFLGGGIASAGLLLVNILAGRYMGPSEYGKYNLVFVLSQFFILFVFWGLDIASIKAIAASKTRAEKGKNLSSASVFLVLTLGLLSLIAFLVYKPAAQYFALDQSLLFILLILSIPLTLKAMFDGFIRGLRLFKVQFVAKTLECFTIIALFVLIFVVLDKRTYEFYIYVLIAGALVSALINFSKVKKYFDGFDKKCLQDQLSHGKFYFIATIIGTLFTSLDRLLVAKYLSYYELGIYGAYYTASVTLTYQLTQMFINVFLPSIAHLENKTFVRKIDNIFTRAIIPIYLTVLVLVFVAVKLFGARFGLIWGYVFGFSLLATLQLIQGIYNTIVLTLSKDLYKRSLLLVNISNVIIFSTYIPLVYFKLISISWILGILILSITSAITIQRTFIGISINRFNQKT